MKTDKKVLVVVFYESINKKCTYYKDFTFLEQMVIAYPNEVCCEGKWKINEKGNVRYSIYGHEGWASDSCSDEVLTALNDLIDEDLLGG